MKRILITVLTHVLFSTCSVVFAQSDTTNVMDFSIDEQDIVLKIGESRQLHVHPSFVEVRWGAMWDLSVNPVLFVDDRGVITALKTGNDVVMAELKADPNINSRCCVTVCNEGSIRKDRVSYLPVDEVNESEISFSLNKDGLFTAEGTFWGSGAQTNYLNYIVADQCIIMSFQIDYADSTRMFYSQPFKFELENCNAQEYNVYLNNRIQTVESQEAFVKYSIARDSSIGDTTETAVIEAREEGTTYFNLIGQRIDTPSGLTLVVTRFSDGSIHTEKLFFR